MNRCRKTSDGTDGCDVEDRPDTLADHLFVERLGHGEQAADICIDDPIPTLVGGRCKIIGLVHRRVVDENVYRTPRVADLASDMLHPETVGDGDFVAECPTPVCLDLFLDVFRQVVA